MMSMLKAMSLSVQSNMYELSTVRHAGLQNAHIWHLLPVACTPCALWLISVALLPSSVGKKAAEDASDRLYRHRIQM